MARVRLTNDVRAVGVVSHVWWRHLFRRVAIQDLVTAVLIQEVQLLKLTLGGAILLVVGHG